MRHKRSAKRVDGTRMLCTHIIKLRYSRYSKHRHVDFLCGRKKLNKVLYCVCHSSFFCAGIGRSRIPRLEPSEQQSAASLRADASSGERVVKMTETPKKQRVPLNCTKAFDSVYYCYSPVHQARQYYITGNLDDCRGRLKRFRMCMLSRFRPQHESELIYEEVERKEQAKMKKPVWEFREEFLERTAQADREERERATSGEKTEEKEAWWL